MDERPLPTPGAATAGDAPWYAEGLRFSCQSGCVECCTGSGGYVWVTSAEAEAIARHLQMEVGDFKQQMCDRYGTRWSIKEHVRSGDCLFLDRERGCTIYPHRPKQCRTFPFWSECVSSPGAWERTARDCPGCNQGELHPQEEIETSAAIASGGRSQLERLYRQLREIYAEADAAVADAGGGCQLSGRCCDLPRRQEERHVTSVEVALLVEDREWDRSAVVDRDPASAGCPFFLEGRCSAHEVRPLACRVYSCEQGFLETEHARILERYRREIQRLEPMFGLPFSTGELREMLARRARLPKRANPVTGR